MIQNSLVRGVRGLLGFINDKQWVDFQIKVRNGLKINKVWILWLLRKMERTFTSSPTTKRHIRDTGLVITCVYTSDRVTTIERDGHPCIIKIIETFVITERYPAGQEGWPWIVNSSCQGTEDCRLVLGLGPLPYKVRTWPIRTQLSFKSTNQNQSSEWWF